MVCQTMLAGIEFSIAGTQSSHDDFLKASTQKTILLGPLGRFQSNQLGISSTMKLYSYDCTI